MDSAILGFCRLGYFRLGVFNLHWDQIIQGFKNVATYQEAAILGFCRLGYFRLGVFRRDWDELLSVLKSVAARAAGGKTPCIQGVAKQGMTRHKVKIPLFDELLEQLKKKV